MTGILAIETATDACSVAYSGANGVVERHEVLARQHNRLVFQLLDELLPASDFAQAGIEHIAYGSGPGSFTGLRIAASFAQGLAYARRISAIPVSTLAIMAQGTLEEGQIAGDGSVLVLLDARINEIYSAVVEFERGLAHISEGPWVSAPADLPSMSLAPRSAIGNGCRYIDELPCVVRESIENVIPESLPRASHMIPLAQYALERGDVQAPCEVVPVYVQDEITWKKLHEQGRPN